MGRQRVVHPEDDAAATPPSTSAPTSATRPGTLAHTDPQTGRRVTGGGAAVTFAFDGADERVATSTSTNAPDDDAAGGQSDPGAENMASCSSPACGTSQVAAQQHAWIPPSNARTDTESEGSRGQGERSGSAPPWGLSSCSERASEGVAGQELDESLQAERLQALQLNGLAPRRASAGPAREASPVARRQSEASPKARRQSVSSIGTDAPSRRKSAPPCRRGSADSTRLGMERRGSGASSRRGSADSSRSSMERRGSGASSRRSSAGDLRDSIRSSMERRGSNARRASLGLVDHGGDEVLLQTFFSGLLAQRANVSRLTIDPDASWLKLWDVVQLLCVFYNFTMVMWRIAFRSGTQFMPIPRMAWSPACAIDWVCDLLLCMHILLHFALGFVDSSNNKVLDRKRISRAYVSSRSFWVHVIALCPLDVVQLVLGQWIPVCRLNKLVRVLELRGILKHLLDAYRVRVHFQRLLWHIFLTLLLSHTIACVYFMFGSLFNGFSYTSWSPPIEVLNETSAMQYFDSVYWSLGLMTGLGDGTVPVTLIESLFTLAVMMAGMFLFATIIGNVSTMVDELNENEGVLQTKLLLMTRMMRQNQLPHELEDRVTNYISYQYKDHQGFDDFQMLQTLPASLRTDIMLQLTRSMIERVPFFHGEAEGFVRSLVDRLKPQIASAGECLIRAGQVPMEMYFVQRGEFDILFGSPPVIVAKLRQGNYFGEALLSEKPCASTIQARTFCDLFTLTRRALVEVLAYYPETEKKMHELVAKRLEEDRLKGKEAMLMSKYGQKWVQQLRNVQYRKVHESRSPSRQQKLSDVTVFGRDGKPVPPSSSNLTASPTKKSFKAITEKGMSTGAIRDIRLARSNPSEGPASPAKKSFKAITEKGMSSGAIAAIRLARSNASQGASTPPLSPIKSKRTQVAPAGSGTLQPTNSAGDGKENGQLKKGAFSMKDVAFSMTCMTRQAAASYKVGVVMDETDASFTKESQKSIKSQGALRSLTPWLARAIGLARARSQEDYCYVVLPYGLTRQLWLLLMLLATTWNIFAVPYSISFIWGYYKLMHGAASLIPFSVYAPVLCVDIIADLIFVADVFLSQRLVFVDAQGGLEKDARVIRRRFFKTGLPRALSAVVALDIIVLAVFDWCPILRLNRLVNFDKFNTLQVDVLQTFQRSTKSSPQSTSLRIFRLFFSFLAISHYIACLSTIVAALGTPLSSISYALEGSTQYPHGVVIEDAFSLYIRAIYFAVSNLTGLGRDVKPVTVAEYLLTCGVWCLGIFVFAYTIGTAGVLIVNSDAGETRFNKKRTSVFNYLANQKLPTEMRTRAFNFFETTWAKTKGVEIQEVVSDLNTALSIDVMSHICRDAVKNVPVFAQKGDQFISSIVQVLSFHAFPQGEWLMRKGTIGKEMFFILQGQVDIIIDEKLMFVIKTLEVGDFVGEGALFQGKGKRGAACCARTSCETMVLSKDGFAHVLQLWPDIEQELLDASKKRQEDTQLVVNALERRIQRDPKIGDSGREILRSGRPSRLRANSVAPTRRLSRLRGSEERRQEDRSCKAASS